MLDNGEDCEAVVDLGKVTRIREISVGSLVNTGIRIFEPMVIDPALTLDGMNCAASPEGER